MKKRFVILFSIISALLISSFTNKSTLSGSYVISGDIASVRIGEQTWMTRNLEVSNFRNGDAIPQVTSKDAWAKAANDKQPAWCYYNFNPAYGSKYGKLYNFWAVNDPRGLAPSGWKIPTLEEWNALTDFLGGSAAAGTKLMSQEGWSSGGTNSSGFSALPGGHCAATGDFYQGDKFAYFWTSTDNTNGEYWMRHLGGPQKEIGGTFYSGGCGLSVRCLKDGSATSSGSGSKHIIAVTFVKTKNSCGSYSDCSWGLSYGDGTEDQFRTQSEAEAKKRCNSTQEGMDSYDNYEWSQHLGNHVSVISSNVTLSGGCQVLKYGVGFGNNVVESLKKAKENLGSRCWSWSESKHGYSVVHSAEK